jgi:hypothetical protein
MVGEASGHKKSANALGFFCVNGQSVAMKKREALNAVIAPKKFFKKEWTRE